MVAHAATRRGVARAAEERQRAPERNSGGASACERQLVGICQPPVEPRTYVPAANLAAAVEAPVPSAAPRAVGAYNVTCCQEFKRIWSRGGGGAAGGRSSKSDAADLPGACRKRAPAPSRYAAVVPRPAGHHATAPRQTAAVRRPLEGSMPTPSPLALALATVFALPFHAATRSSSPERHRRPRTPPPPRLSATRRAIPSSRPGRMVLCQIFTRAQRRVCRDEMEYSSESAHARRHAAAARPSACACPHQPQSASGAARPPSAATQPRQFIDSRDGMRRVRAQRRQARAARAYAQRSASPGVSVPQRAAKC